jgi:type II secretory pathway component PulK
LFRAGFDKTDRLQLFAQANHDKTILPVVFANPSAKPVNKEGQPSEGAAATAPGQSSTSVATQPDATQPIR